MIMILSFLFLGLALVIAMVLVTMWTVQRHRVCRDDIELLHYTHKDAVKKIRASKKLIIGKDGCCYFFIKGRKPVSNWNIHNSHLEETDTILVVKGLDDAQRKAHRFDLRPTVFKHEGEFLLLDEDAYDFFERVSYEKTAYCQPRRKKCRSSDQQRG